MARSATARNTYRVDQGRPFENGDQLSRPAMVTRDTREHGDGTRPSELDDEALDRPVEIVSWCCSKFPVDDDYPPAPANENPCHN